MPLVDLTYDLTNGTPADADQVMQNFADVTAVLNGHVDLTNLELAAVAETLLAATTQAAQRTALGLDALAVLAAVNTGQIVDGAVTPTKRSPAVKATVMGSGVMTTPADTNPVDCLDVALTSTGRPVLVNWVVTANNANSGIANPTATAKMGLDGTQIGLTRIADIPLVSGDVHRVTLAGTAIVTPDADSHTYGMFVTTSHASAIEFLDGEITVVEL